jgi:hypothetical protein
MAIRTTIVEKNGKKLLQFEVDGKGGKATATLTGESVISLRNRLDRLVVDLVDWAIDKGAEIEDVLEGR